MNKHHIATAALTLAAALLAPNAMAFGLGDLPGFGGSGSKAAAPDPDAFLKSAVIAEKMMNNSVALLSRSLTSKENAAKLEAEKKAAQAVTDPAERQAKLTEVRKSEIAAVNEALNDAQLQESIKKMDSQKKDELAGAAHNFILSLLLDKDLVGQSSSLLSSMSSNPAYLSKLGTIKNVASSLSNQISDASKVAGKLPDIFAAVGVKAPVSKDDKPKVVAQVDTE